MMEIIFWLGFKWFMTFKRPTQKTSTLHPGKLTWQWTKHIQRCISKIKAALPNHFDPATKRRVWMCVFCRGLLGSPVPTGDLRLPWFLGWWFSSHGAMLVFGGVDFEAIKALLLRRAILWFRGGLEGTWLPITLQPRRWQPEHPWNQDRKWYEIWMMIFWFVHFAGAIIM